MIESSNLDWQDLYDTIGGLRWIPACTGMTQGKWALGRVCKVRITMCLFLHEQTRVNQQAMGAVATATPAPKTLHWAPGGRPSADCQWSALAAACIAFVCRMLAESIIYTR